MNRRRFLAAALALTLLGPALAGQDREKEKEPDLLTRLKKVKGAFSLTVTIKVKKGEEKTLIKAFEPAIAAAVEEKGCKRYELHQDIENPRKFLVIERWDSVADIEAHLGSGQTKKIIALLEKIADGPLEIVIAKRRVHVKK